MVMSADRGGTTIEALCRQIHKTLIADFQYSLVWGTSSKHYPQRWDALPSKLHRNLALCLRIFIVMSRSLRTRAC